MSLFDLILLSVGLSMDALAVAVCKGFALRKTTLRHALTVGIWFGGFQALMPLLGYLAGARFKDAIAACDHWIAFGLLLLIGGNMVREALCGQEEKQPDAALSPRAMLPLAAATSIDALAAGVTFACLDQRIHVGGAVLLIGCTTLIISAWGVRLGSLFGDRMEKKAEILGGVILVLLGVKILMEHMGVI